MSATDLDPDKQPQSEADEAADQAEAADAPETEAPDVEALRAELEQAQAKAAENWDRALRLQAEMDNQRKRSQREVENAHKYALENFAVELLNVRDSLEMGLAVAKGEDATLESIVEGTELTLRMLVQVMDKFKIVEVNPMGEKFNPDLHQAMSMVAVEGAEPNSVTQVIQKGYTLNDRLIRPALVAVAR